MAATSDERSFKRLCLDIASYLAERIPKGGCYRLPETLCSPLHQAGTLTQIAMPNLFYDIFMRCDHVLRLHPRSFSKIFAILLQFSPSKKWSVIVHNFLDVTRMYLDDDLAAKRLSGVSRKQITASEVQVARQYISMQLIKLCLCKLVDDGSDLDHRRLCAHTLRLMSNDQSGISYLFDDEANFAKLVHLILNDGDYLLRIMVSDLVRQLLYDQAKRKRKPTQPKQSCRVPVAKKPDSKWLGELRAWLTRGRVDVAGTCHVVHLSQVTFNRTTVDDINGNIVAILTDRLTFMLPAKLGSELVVIDVSAMGIKVDKSGSRRLRSQNGLVTIEFPESNGCVYSCGYGLPLTRLSMCINDPVDKKSFVDALDLCSTLERDPEEAMQILPFGDPYKEDFLKQFEALSDLSSMLERVRDDTFTNGGNGKSSVTLGNVDSGQIQGQVPQLKDTAHMEIAASPLEESSGASSFQHANGPSTTLYRKLQLSQEQGENDVRGLRTSEIMDDEDMEQFINYEPSSPTLQVSQVRPKVNIEDSARTDLTQTITCAVVPLVNRNPDQQQLKASLEVCRSTLQTDTTSTQEQGGPDQMIGATDIVRVTDANSTHDVDELQHSSVPNTDRSKCSVEPDGNEIPRDLASTIKSNSKGGSATRPGQQDTANNESGGGDKATQKFPFGSKDNFIRNVNATKSTTSGYHQKHTIHSQSVDDVTISNVRRAKRPTAIAQRLYNARTSDITAHPVSRPQRKATQPVNEAKVVPIKKAVGTDEVGTRRASKTRRDTRLDPGQIDKSDEKPAIPSPSDVDISNHLKTAKLNSISTVSSHKATKRTIRSTGMDKSKKPKHQTCTSNERTYRSPNMTASSSKERNASKRADKSALPRHAISEDRRKGENRINRFRVEVNRGTKQIRPSEANDSTLPIQRATSSSLRTPINKPVIIHFNAEGAVNQGTPSLKKQCRFKPSCAAPDHLPNQQGETKEPQRANTALHHHRQPNASETTKKGETDKFSRQLSVKCDDYDHDIGDFDTESHGQPLLIANAKPSMIISSQSKSLREESATNTVVVALARKEVSACAPPQEEIKSRTSLASSRTAPSQSMGVFEAAPNSFSHPSPPRADIIPPVKASQVKVCSASARPSIPVRDYRAEEQLVDPLTEKLPTMAVTGKADHTFSGDVGEHAHDQLGVSEDIVPTVTTSIHTTSRVNDQDGAIVQSSESTRKRPRRKLSTVTGSTVKRAKKTQDSSGRSEAEIERCSVREVQTRSSRLKKIVRVKERGVGMQGQHQRALPTASAIDEIQDTPQTYTSSLNRSVQGGLQPLAGLSELSAKTVKERPDSTIEGERTLLNTIKTSLTREKQYVTTADRSSSEPDFEETPVPVNVQLRAQKPPTAVQDQLQGALLSMMNTVRAQLAMHEVATNTTIGKLKQGGIVILEELAINFQQQLEHRCTNLRRQIGQESQVISGALEMIVEPEKERVDTVVGNENLETKLKEIRKAKEKNLSKLDSVAV